MPITFGSVGDIVTVSLLIKDLVNCLDKSRGSSAEYQAVIRELWSLDHALLEVEVLLRFCEKSVELNDLRETADRCTEQCRECIENFRGRITKKYQSSLQGGGTGHLVRDATAKIRWHVSEKDDLAKFRVEIAAYWSSMNMLLATAGIKLSTLNDEGMRKRLKQSDLAHANSSATQTSLLTDLNTRLEDTNALIHAAASETKALRLKIDLDYFRNFGAQLLSFMNKIWRINSMTYNAVVSLQTRIPAQLDRSWTQEPVMLEDALGRVTPFHVDFIESWEAFEAILEHRFRHLPGHRKIKQKEYVLRSNLMNKDVDSSIPFHHCFLPGQHYDMSMIFNAAYAHNSCPACLMSSDEASDARVMCKGCGLLYQRLLETMTETASILPRSKVATTVPLLKRRRDEDDENDDEPKQFRRVRIKCRRVPRTRGSQDNAKQETLKSGEQMIRCVGAANDNDPEGGFHCGQCSKVEEKYTIKCICDSDTDDGNTVYCEPCDTWQHVRCYYDSGISMAELAAIDHFCKDCGPPLVDATKRGRRNSVEATMTRNGKQNPTKYLLLTNNHNVNRLRLSQSYCQEQAEALRSREIPDSVLTIHQSSLDKEIPPKPPARTTSTPPPSTKTHKQHQ